MMNNLASRITIDKDVCKGKPTIRRMRFTVAQMLELKAAGMTDAEILNDYPYIEAEDIAACLRYASCAVSNRNLLHVELEYA